MKLTLVQTLVQAIVQHLISMTTASCVLGLLNIAGIGFMTASIDSRVQMPNIVVQMAELRPHVTTIRKEAYGKLEASDSGDEDTMPTPFSEVSLT